MAPNTILQINGTFIRNPKGSPKAGSFAALNSELKRTLVQQNTAMAKRLQASIVEQLNESLVRKEAHTGRLAKAMLDEGNRYLEPNGRSWGVGRPKFLDQSVAKYWRTIELGSAATWSRGGMRGMKLYPYLEALGKVSDSRKLAWKSGFSGYHRNRWGLAPTASGAAPASPGFPSLIRPWYGARFVTRWGSKGYQPFVVKKEIEPHRYILHGAEAMNLTQVLRKTYQETITDFVVRSFRPTGYRQPTGDTSGLL